MKNLFILLVCILTLGSYGQTSSDRGYDIFIGFSIDPKMALEGPYAGKSNDIGTTFNGEFKLGIEQDFLRAGMYYETHPAIGYSKWTWIALDYKIVDVPVENFGIYIGAESSVIYRRHKDAWYGNPNNFRRKTSTRVFNPGLNLEFQYRMYRKWYCGAGFNAFRAEQELIDEGKEIRWDFMVSIYWKV